MILALIVGLIGLWLGVQLVRTRQQLAFMRKSHTLRSAYVRDYYQRRVVSLIRQIDDGDGGMKAAQVYPPEDAIDERRSCGVYRQSNEARAIRRLLQLKYGKVTRAEAELLASQIASYLALQFAITDWTPTLITAVPSTDIKLSERGFNQAELIAREFAYRVSLPYTHTLCRARQTEAQAKIKTKADRLKNLMGAFEAVGDFANEQILLIDDVATTGMTAMECARALKASGAAKVWVLTLASGRAANETSREIASK